MICFFDTNVLVYAVDAGDPARRERALNRLARAASEGAVVLSTQVLQEFYAIATRKLQPPLPAPEAAAQVQRLCAFQVMGSTAQSVQAAIALAQEHQPIYQRTGFLRHREAAGRGDPAAAPTLPARRFPADRPTRCLHRVGQIAWRKRWVSFFDSCPRLSGGR